MNTVLHAFQNSRDPKARSLGRKFVQKKAKKIARAKARREAAERKARFRKAIEARSQLITNLARYPHHPRVDEWRTQVDALNKIIKENQS